MIVDPRPAVARRLLGLPALPQGLVVVGVLRKPPREDVALVWTPGGWRQGGKGGLRTMDAAAAQSAWLKALRAGSTLESVCRTAGCSPRTWEGWEQGRRIPPEAVYMLAVNHRAPARRRRN